MTTKRATDMTGDEPRRLASPAPATTYQHAFERYWSTTGARERFRELTTGLTVRAETTAGTGAGTGHSSRGSPRDRRQRSGTAGDQAGMRKTPFTAGWNGGPLVTTTRTPITTGLTPAEAAALLEKLEEGQQAAWLATRHLPWHSAEYQARFHTAAEVDGVFRDLMWETLTTGLRRPGEPVEEFADRARGQARRAPLPQASAGAAPGPVIRSACAGRASQRTGDGRDEIPDRLLASPDTPEGQAYTRALSEGAAAEVREVRAREPLPEPDRTPGAAHPDPVLAARGWHVSQHGTYTRRPTTQPQPAPRLDKELEAG